MRLLYVCVWPSAVSVKLQSAQGYSMLGCVSELVQSLVHVSVSSLLAVYGYCGLISRFLLYHVNKYICI